MTLPIETTPPLIVHKEDPENVERRFERELRVSSALGDNASHVSVHIWGMGHEEQAVAGLCLTFDETVALINRLGVALANHATKEAPDVAPR